LRGRGYSGRIHVEQLAPAHLKLLFFEQMDIYSTETNVAQNQRQSLSTGLTARKHTKKQKLPTDLPLGDFE
jgi:hypothetical protein